MSGAQYDDPNREAVGLDPAWVEGTGGTSETPEPQTSGGGNLDSMTKDELLDYATSLGVSPANSGMTKEELREAIDAKLAEGQ